jgi:hypothetical protein
MKNGQRFLHLNVSIRAMLLVLSVFAGLFALAARRESQRRELIATIEEIGGSATLSNSESWLLPSISVESVTVPYAALGQIELLELETLIQPKQLTVSQYELQRREDSNFDHYYLDLQYKLTPEGSLASQFGSKPRDLRN